MGYSLNQSSTRRAWEETKKLFHSIPFWLLEVVGGGAFLYLAIIITPENADIKISAAYQAIGAIIGAIVVFGVTYMIMLVISPYKQRNEARKLYIRTLGESNATGPKIDVTPVVRNNQAILEVYDAGLQAQFTAMGRVVSIGDRDPELYVMHWKAYNSNSCDINTQGTKSILVAGISSVDDNTQNLHANGLELYKMETTGIQTFGARTLERVGRSFLSGVLFKDKPSKEPEYNYFDKCIVEVVITSNPQLIEPFRRYYTLEVKYQSRYLLHELLFTRSNPDKGDLQRV